MGPGLFFVYFRSFRNAKTNRCSTNLTLNDKSVDGVLGTSTWGGRMEGADESTELWRHPAQSYTFHERCNGCGSVGKVVVSETRDPEVRNQSLANFIYNPLYFKTELKR